MFKKKSLQIASSVLLLCFAYIVCNVVFPEYIYQSQILLSIKRADQIKLIEHSDSTDIKNLSDNYQETVYQSVLLSGSEIEALRNAVPLTSDPKFNHHKFCGFAPHHRLEFFRSGKCFKKLEICFLCNEISFEGINEKKGIPDEWEEPLRNFVKSMKMNPDIGQKP